MFFFAIFFHLKKKTEYFNGILIEFDHAWLSLMLRRNQLIKVKLFIQFHGIFFISCGLFGILTSICNNHFELNNNNKKNRCWVWYGSFDWCKFHWNHSWSDTEIEILLSSVNTWMWISRIICIHSVIKVFYQLNDRYAKKKKVLLKLCQTFMTVKEWSFISLSKEWAKWGWGNAKKIFSNVNRMRWHLEKPYCSRHKKCRFHDKSALQMSVCRWTVWEMQLTWKECLMFIQSSFVTAEKSGLQIFCVISWRNAGSFNSLKRLPSLSYSLT